MSNDPSRPTSIQDQMRRARARWVTLTFYEKYEQFITFILTALIAIVVGIATWHLMVAVANLAASDQLAPAEHAAFQLIFGMIFTVIIALEFKHSLLVVLTGQGSIIRLRTIILIAMLGIARKFIIAEFGTISAVQMFSLAAAILALGIVYWLVRDQDRRDDIHKRSKRGAPDTELSGLHPELGPIGGPPSRSNP